MLLLVLSKSGPLPLRSDLVNPLMEVSAYD